MTGDVSAGAVQGWRDTPLVRGVVLCVAYFLTATLGLQWAIIPGVGSAIWPAAGVAIAGLVIWGWRLWPAIVVARFLTALAVGSPQPWWADLGIALSTTMGALVPAYLFERYRLFTGGLGRMTDVVWLIGLASVGGAVFSAALAAIPLSAAGTPPDRLLAVCVSWALGFGVGVLVVAPLLLSWWCNRGRPITGRRLAHLAVALGLTTVLGYFVFQTPEGGYLRVWHIFPALIWIALVFNVRGTSLALGITSLLAIWAALTASGPLTVGGSAQDQLLLTQQFIFIAGATMLFLGAAVDQIRDAEAQARLAAIVSASPDAMLSCDTQGHIQSWNPAAERLFGYSAQEVQGRTFDFLLPSSEEPVFHRALREGVAESEGARLRKDGRTVEVAIAAAQIKAQDGTVLGVAGVMHDITRRNEAQRYQQLLINELNHRVKNTLAIIQAIAQQSFGGDKADASARAAFEGRLMALSAAHDVLTRENWESASMRQIVEDAVLLHGGGENRFRIAGPDLRLAPKTAVSLALALHELATNAVKYGALSRPEGQVLIAWSSEGGRLHFTWSERGGPPVVTPTRRGFGTRLIERSLAAEFGGTVRIDFAPEGIICTVDAPHGAHDEGVA